MLKCYIASEMHAHTTPHETRPTRVVGNPILRHSERAGPQSPVSGNPNDLRCCGKLARSLRSARRLCVVVSRYAQHLLFN